MVKQKKKNHNNLIFLIAIIFIFLIIFIIIYSLPLISGKKYVLATINSDPRGYSKGDNMDIKYEITNLHIEGLPNSLSGKTIYIYLKKDPYEVWRFNGYSLEKPSDTDFIAGEIKKIDNSRITISYGIESYSFKKKAYIDGRNILVNIMVSSSGQARITKLTKEGKPI